MGAYRAAFTGGGTSGSGDRTVTFTPAVDDLLVVFASVSGSTDTGSMTDDQGGTYYVVYNALNWGTAGANSMGVYIRDARVSSAVQHIITLNTVSNSAGALGVIALSGTAKVGASAHRSEGGQANQAASTTPAPVLGQAALTSNVTLAAVASGDTTTTPNASWVERVETSQSTPTTALEVGTRDSGFTGTTITFGATCSTTFASAALEIDCSNAGALSKTLGAATSSAAGAVQVKGTLAKTLGAVTLSSTGTAGGAITGVLDQTLGAATASGAGKVQVQGALTKTLAAATSSATGAVALVGGLSSTLGAATLGATGAVQVQGALSKTLDTATASAGGVVGVAGALSKTLGTLAGVAAGAVKVQGAASPQLGSLGLASTGEVDVTGALAVSLGAATVTAAGKVQVQGVAAKVLGSLGLSTAGAVGVAAALAVTLGGMTSGGYAFVPNSRANRGYVSPELSRVNWARRHRFR